MLGTNSSKSESSEVRKASFWVSQLFMLVATVLGVYLAATQGFQQAVNFDSIQRDRSNYYLRQSLRGELVANVAIMRDYMQKVQSGVMPQTAKTSLNSFVWESMKNAPNTLETPSSILSEAQRFYNTIPQIMESVGTTTSIAVANKQLNEWIDRIEKDLLPQIDKNSEELLARLKKANISL